MSSQLASARAQLAFPGLKKVGPCPEARCGVTLELSSMNTLLWAWVS